MPFPGNLRRTSRQTCRGGGTPKRAVTPVGHLSRGVRGPRPLHQVAAAMESGLAQGRLPHELDRTSSMGASSQPSSFCAEDTEPPKNRLIRDRATGDACPAPSGDAWPSRRLGQGVAHDPARRNGTPAVSPSDGGGHLSRSARPEPLRRHIRARSCPGPPMGAVGYLSSIPVRRSL